MKFLSVICNTCPHLRVKRWNSCIKNYHFCSVKADQKVSLQFFFFPLTFTDSSETKYLMGELNKEVSSGWLILVGDSSSVVESDYQFELICFNFPFLSFACIPKLIESSGPEHLPTHWLWARLLRSQFWSICNADLAARFQKSVLNVTGAFTSNMTIFSECGQK